jgi:uncharacterized protein
MNKEVLKEVLIDQKESFNHNRSLVDREIDLSPFLKTNQVVVISGIRRCGKSSLLFLIKQSLKLKESDYCYVNFDDERIMNETSTLDQIYQLHLELYKKEPIFFFDEIQNITQWEKFVNRMYERGLKLFVTGSNANLLSSEVATRLTGRNRVIQLYPFSFAEYLRQLKKTFEIDNLTSQKRSLLQSHLNDYIHYGGFPLVVKEFDLELINNYFQDILYRDIISRYKLIQVNEIKQIALYFASNIGKPFSYSTLQAITGIKSTASIKSYLEYFEQSYLFFYLKKHDYSVKKQIMNPKKVYSIDSAFVHRLGFAFSENLGRVLENIVFMELLRRGKEVYYHQRNHECDFLLKEGLKITAAIQVCWDLNKLTLERELEGLNEAMTLYRLKKGTIIIYDSKVPDYSLPRGIAIVPVQKWLLDK